MKSLKIQEYKRKPQIVHAMKLEKKTWQTMCKFINLNSMNPNGPKGVYVKDGKQIVKWEPGAELILLLPDGKSYRKVREGEWVVRDWGNISKYTQEDFDAMFEIVLE